jgi:hypothetical protein
MSLFIFDPLTPCSADERTRQPGGDQRGVTFDTGVYNIARADLGRPGVVDDVSLMPSPTALMC